MTKSQTEEPNVGDVPGKPVPKEYQGCPCMCFNAYRTENVDTDQNGRIRFPKPNKKPGTSNYSTFGSNWNGITFIVPVSGIYFTMVSGIRDGGAVQDDAYIRLNSDVHGVIDFALIGETAVNFTKSKYGELQYDRQTGVLHRIAYYDAGERLWLDTDSDSNRHVHLINIKWSLFHICCNPQLEIPGC